MVRSNKKFRCLASVVGLLCWSNVQAQPDDIWQHCRSVFIPKEFQGLTKFKDLSDATEVTADEASVRKQEYFELKGRVELKKSTHFLSADQANYHRGEDTVEALGSVRFETDNFLISGKEAFLNLKKNQGKITASRFWLPKSHLRGQADSISLQSADAMTLDKAVFTSCNEDDTAWKLRAGELQLDRAENKAVVYHARLELFDVPVLYFPYLNLPLEGRKTGLLIPNMGHSTESGSEFNQPFYWNIAPNRDATITAHYFSKRGTQAKGEFRYLNPGNAGQLNVEYLGSDSLYGNDRSYVALQQYWRQMGSHPEWWADVQYKRVSDDDYLKDFGGHLNLSSLSYLERVANLHFQKNGWQLHGLAQHFQILDKNIAADDRPMQRLPQFQLSSPMLQTYGFKYGIETEWVRFNRATGLMGDRADLYSILQWPQHTYYGFIKPTVGLRHTRYSLKNNQSSSDASPHRTIPSLSLDNGLFFERNLILGKRNLIQTLEPRLYYLYVPYRDQSRLLLDQSGAEKVFDSSATRLDFAQMFRDNRYMGLDRIGDTNQISLALTSRLLSPSGREVLSASIGQIRYFKDRRVSLPGGTIQTENRSDTLISLSGQISNSSQLLTEFAWNDKASSTVRSSLQFRFNPSETKEFSVAYRYERKIIEQTDFSLLLPIDKQWKIVALWNYSLLDDVTLENIQGVEYNSCCWALRLVRRETIEDLVSRSYNDSLLIQFELKGLASVGSKAAAFFDRGYWTDRD